jgi:hypothetical protein
MIYSEKVILIAKKDLTNLKINMVHRNAPFKTCRTDFLKYLGRGRGQGVVGCLGATAEAILILKLQN